MRVDEGEKVIETMLTADGNCAYCSYHLLKYFIEDFPEFEKVAIDMWEKANNMEWKDTFEW